MDAQYISAITALGAVILSPLIAIFTVNTQMKISTLSVNRQKWIDDLRSAISEYCGLMHYVNQSRSVGHLTYSEVYPILQKSFELESKIMLLVNPNEEKHKKITELTTEGRVALFSTDDQYDPNTWNNVWYKLIPLTNTILKEEWERVKTLK